MAFRCFGFGPTSTGSGALHVRAPSRDSATWNSPSRQSHPSPHGVHVGVAENLLIGGEDREVPEAGRRR